MARVYKEIHLFQVIDTEYPEDSRTYTLANVDWTESIQQGVEDDMLNPASLDDIL